MPKSTDKRKKSSEDGTRWDKGRDIQRSLNPVIASLIAHMKARTQIEIEYATKNSRYSAKRTITPYRVYKTADGESPYVKAYCHKKEAIRVFRTDRIFIDGVSKARINPDGENNKSTSKESTRNRTSTVKKSPTKNRATKTQGSVSEKVKATPTTTNQESTRSTTMPSIDIYEKDDTIDHDHVFSVIETLRKKLLDFSTRNDLINLTHSDRSTKFIRVVDELPNQLYERLRDGAMTFKPLPEVEEEPPDEKTDNFQIALKEARVINEEYLAGIEDLGDKETDEEELQRLERQLKDVVREQLGLDPIQRGATIDVRAHARIHGFNPSYDLPKVSDEDKESEHTDNKIQTLLLPERFERRARSLADKYRSHIRETGINVFNAAFGFVEWYDSPSSDRALFAPLLLMPLDIERKATPGGATFPISSPGETLEVNVTFAERLNLDFGITLPELEEDSTPERYFSQVESLIQKHNRWRLRRFVTIGIFPFQKMAMYMDLDPNKWPEPHYLTGHEGIAKLLGGRTSEGLGVISDNHDIDQLTVKGIAPGLVLDADASQHSALVDVCEGKSLVIQGPPGTGKSQTIANLIASAVGEGKSVLFVAEKQAALNVVANRLKDKKVGLGTLLMELQRRGDKRVLLQSLDERLRCTKPVASKELDAKKAQILELRNDIEDHRLLLNKATDFDGHNGFELIWKFLRFQKRFKELGLAREPRYFGRKLISNDSLGKDKSTITEYFEVEGIARNDSVDLEGITHLDPNPIAVRELMSFANEITSNLEELQQDFIDFSNRSSGDAYGDIFELSKFINDATEKYAIPVLLEVLEKSDEFKNLCEYDEEFESVSEQLGQYLNLSDHDPQAVTRVLEAFRNIGQEQFRVGDIPTILGEWELVIDKLNLVQREIRKVPTLLDLTINEALLIRTASIVLSEEQDQSLELLKPELLQGKAIQKISGLAERIKNVQGIDRELEESGVDTRIAVRDYQPRELDEAGQIVLRGSILSIFSKPYKSAKRLSILLGIDPTNKTDAVRKFKKLSVFVEKVQELRDDAEAHQTLGSTYESENTDRQKLVNLLSAIEKVKEFLDMISASSTLSKLSLSSLTTVKNLASNPEFTSACDGISESNLSNQDDLETELEKLRNKVKQIQKIQTDVLSAGFLSNVDIPTGGFINGDKHDFPLTPYRTSIADLLFGLEDLSRQSTPLRNGLSQELQRLHWKEGKALHDSANTISNLVAQAAHGQLPPKILFQPIRVEVNSAFLQLGQSVFRDISVVDEMLDSFEKRYEVVAEFWSGTSRSEYSISWLIERFKGIGNVNETDALSSARMIRLKKNLQGTALGKFIDDYRDVARGPHAICVAYEYSAVTAALRNFANENAVTLADLTGVKVQGLKDAFRATDQDLFALEAKRVLREGLNRSIPYGNDTGPKREWTDRALIDNEIGKKRGHIAVRALVRRAGNALFAMKPIWLMSPLAVSLFLNKKREQFDLLVIDEASQMRPEDALTAIVRAKSVVVVGDDQQLPPTSFFRTDLDSGDEEQEVETESILDLSTKRLSDTRQLRWHYRSRHPDLIRFSNRKFYKDRLQTFPSPVTKSSSLGVTHVAVDGFYKSSVNVEEAKEVVRQARQCMAECPDMSIGIVTMNVHQKDLIREEFERLMEEDRTVGDYVQNWSEHLEEFIIKNLENIQGDERDIVIVSTVYGRDQEAGIVYQRFAGINSVYGHRRLNVLFSRAKRRVILVTSLRATDVKLNENQNPGVRIFRQYLEYAATGRLETGDFGGGVPDSDFEVMVAEALRDSGYQPTTQVGVVGFKIDIGVSNEDYPHGYIAGIECDGATYHSGASARDRDRIRQDVLEGLGWEIYRIWSTDWFSNPEVETQKLVSWLEERRKVYLSTPETEAVAIEPIYVN